MKKYLDILKKTKLFYNFTEQELLSILNCLNAKVILYKKEQAILLAGQSITQIGIVLSGKTRIQRDDINGDVVIVDEFLQGDIFAEGFVCAGVQYSPVNIWSVTDCEIMLLDYQKIITTCESSCNFHTQLINNMLRTLAQKLIAVNQKLAIVQKNSIRDKLLAYFELCIKQAGSNSFVSAFDRNTLAGYLSVNRSALSRELSNMRADGLIEYSGNKFRVL